MNKEHRVVLRKENRALMLSHGNDFLNLFKRITFSPQQLNHPGLLYRYLLRLMSDFLPLSFFAVMRFQKLKGQIAFVHGVPRALDAQVPAVIRRYLNASTLSPSQRMALIEHQLNLHQTASHHCWLFASPDPQSGLWLLIAVPQRCVSGAKLLLELIGVKFSLLMSQRRHSRLAKGYECVHEQLRDVKRLDLIHCFALELSQLSSKGGASFFHSIARLLQKPCPASTLHFLSCSESGVTVHFSSSSCPLQFSPHLLYQLQQQGEPLLVPKILVERLHPPCASVQPYRSAAAVPLMLSESRRALLLLESAEQPFRMEQLPLFEYIAAVMKASLMEQRCDIVNRKLTQIERAVSQRNDSLSRLHREVALQVSQRQDLEHQLFLSMLHDPLTALANRLLITDRLEQSLLHQKRHKDQLALLFIDLDNFKQINDEQGHLIGDQLLKAVSKKMLTCVRANDLVARWGGDEFVILLDQVKGRDEVELVLGRLKAVFSEPVALVDNLILCECSIGVNLFGAGRYADVESVIHDADVAMYEAKKRAGTAICYFKAVQMAQLSSQASMTRHLSHALESGEIVPHYQPMIRLLDHQLMGFELMARWQQGEKPVRMAVEFIPLAERSGLVTELDLLMVSSAIEQLQQWHHSHNGHRAIRIAINLSGRHFVDEQGLERIVELVKRSKVDRSRLVFEFSERDVVQYNGQAMTTMQNLHREGVMLGLDDFGTGFSSLNALFEYPIDFIKVDRSFTQRMMHSSRDQALMRAIRDISNDLGFGVIIEGIETRSQHNKLIEMGCEYGQGYYIAHPMQREVVTRMLDKPH